MYETLDQLVRGVIKPSDLPPSPVFRQHDKHDNHVDLRHQLGKGERSIAPQGARARTQSHEAELDKEAPPTSSAQRPATALRSFFSSAASSAQRPVSSRIIAIEEGEGK